MSRSTDSVLIVGGYGHVDERNKARVTRCAASLKTGALVRLIVVTQPRWLAEPKPLFAASANCDCTWCRCHREAPHSAERAA